LVKCVKKYGVSFETVNLSMEILRQMLLWHHPGEDGDKRQENNGKKAHCLRSNHGALTIGNGLDITLRLGNPLHSARATCACDECEEDRERHRCKDPHACTTKAVSRLRQIQPKWIP
ncbi:hypothetical protein B0H10DRAFT_1649651, partial [Mycena sp. CBHHK59/15]